MLVDVAASAYLADPSAYWRPRCPVSLAVRDDDVDLEEVDGERVAVIAVRGDIAGTVLERYVVRERAEVISRREGDQ